MAWSPSGVLGPLTSHGPATPCLFPPGEFEIEAIPAVRHGRVDFCFAEFGFDVLGEQLRNAHTIENIALGIPDGADPGAHIQKGFGGRLMSEFAMLPDKFTSLDAVVTRVLNNVNASSMTFVRFAFYEKRWALDAVLESHVLIPNAVEKIARAYVSGRNAFYADCRIYLGISPGDWMRERRLELAAAWHWLGNIPVADVAPKLGYSSGRGLEEAYRARHQRPIKPERRDITWELAEKNDFMSAVRPFWWREPLPLVDKDEKLVLPEDRDFGRKPQEIFEKSACSDFWSMKPEALTKIIPFPSNLPTLLQDAA